MGIEIEPKSENLEKEGPQKSMRKNDAQRDGQKQTSVPAQGCPRVDLSCLRQYTRSGPGEVSMHAKILLQTGVQAAICR